MTGQHARDLLRYWRTIPWQLRVAWHTGRAAYHQQRGRYWQALNEGRRDTTEHDLDLTGEEQQ